MHILDEQKLFTFYRAILQQLRHGSSINSSSSNTVSACSIFMVPHDSDMYVINTCEKVALLSIDCCQQGLNVSEHLTRRSKSFVHCLLELLLPRSEKLCHDIDLMLQFVISEF